MSKIVLKGTANIREFGGIENKLGREIMYKRFLRSSELSRLQKEDVDALNTKFCVSKIIDLRNPTEVLAKPNVQIPNCEEVNIPLFKDNIPGFTTDEKLDKNAVLNMNDVYRRLTSDFTINQLKKIFSIVLSAEKPVMWVSSAGRDRAGLVSALFLKILDVEDEEIMKDYLFSNECLKATGLKGLFGKKSDPKEAKPEYLELVLNAFKDKYGSLDAFLEKELGVTKEVKTKFQKRCLLNL